jgi:hypothetical protein
VDYDSKNIVFPPEIYSTAQRPDIVIYSPAASKVIMIELTCPAEEGIEAAAVRKQARYILLKERSEAGLWSAAVLNIEVGARGFVALSVHRCLAALGFSGRATNKICRRLGEVVARCSYAIYLSSSNPVWDKKRPLLMSASNAPKPRG